MFEIEEPNALRPWKLGDSTPYAEWPKVADAVIEADLCTSAYRELRYRLTQRAGVRLCIIVLKHDITQNFMLSMGIVEQVDPCLPGGGSMAPGVLEYRLHLLLCRLRRVRLDGHTPRGCDDRGHRHRIAHRPLLSHARRKA